MKLKHGKKYETADGTVYKVRMWSGVYDVCDETWAQWKENGKSLGDTPDLIRRHYTKPKPASKLDLQPGDVARLDGWEDGCRDLIGDFGELKGPHFHRGRNVCTFCDSQMQKGNRPLFKIISRASWSK